MNRWVVGIGAALLLLLLLVVAGGAAFYFLYWHPRQDAGPLGAEALHLPADVGVVGGVDLPTVFATPLFTLAKSQDSVASGLQEVKDKLGIDVEKDLQKVAFGSWVGAGKESEGVALLSGSFSVDRLRQSLEKEGKTGRDLAGVRVYDLDSNTTVALVSERLVALGTKGRLAAYLENRQAGRRPLGEHATLMERLRSIPKETAIFVQVGEPALAGLSKEAGEGAPMGLKPPPLKSLTLTADLSPGLTLVVAARPLRERDAEEFGKQLEAVVTMGGAFVGDNPDHKRIFEGLKVSRGPGEVKVTLTAPWDVLGKAFVTPLVAARISSNESATIGNIRTMISAQATYQSASGGLYGTVECLKNPGSCLPEQPEYQFLDSSFVCPGEKNGYRYDFLLSPGRDGYAVTAVPSKVGETGKRSFCGDDQGLLCQRGDGLEFDLGSGRCPSDCEPVS